MFDFKMNLNDWLSEGSDGGVYFLSINIILSHLDSPFLRVRQVIVFLDTCCLKPWQSISPFSLSLDWEQLGNSGGDNLARNGKPWCQSQRVWRNSSKIRFWLWVPSLKLIAKAPEKMDAWNTILSFWGPAYFEVLFAVSFTEGIESFDKSPRTIWNCGWWPQYPPTDHFHPGEGFCPISTHYLSNWLETRV